MSPDDPTPHLERFETYEEACREFRFNIPERFNIAQAICGRHRDAVTRVGLTEVREAAANTYTFGALDYFSDKFAMVLTQAGIREGDAIAVALEQSAAFAVAHLGALKLGAVVVPVAIDTSPEQAALILDRCHARAAVVEESVRRDATMRFDSVETVFVASDNIHSHVAEKGDHSFWREIYEASSAFDPPTTTSNSPAFAFHIPTIDGGLREVTRSHAALIGDLPAFEMCNDFDLGDEDVYWTGEDWASPAALFGVILPAWYFGCSIVASTRSSFGRRGSLSLIGNCDVTSALLTLSQVDAWRNDPFPDKPADLKLRRVIFSDPLSRSLLEWVRSELNASAQSYLLTVEAGAVAATCNAWFDSKPGTAGKAAPGRNLEIVDAQGNVLGIDQPGYFSVDAINATTIRREPKPSNGAVAEVERCITGRIGSKDVDGYISVGPAQFALT